MTKLEFVCDGPNRHLICVPYSVNNLHEMASRLGIKRCWFHKSHGHEHYDIPKTRIAEITTKCRVVTSREILEMMRNT